ncbi:MAG: ATP-binding protein, partial [Candidatus Wallbacteria bacterium]
LLFIIHCVRGVRQIGYRSVDWPESKVLEIHSLKENFRAMSDKLKEKFMEQKKYNNELLFLNDELKTAKNTAEEANASKSRFLAYISHDIRTPMNAVRGMIDIIEGDPYSSEIKEYLGVMRQSSDMMIQLLNDLLDFSKIEANKLSLESINFDLTEVLEHVIKLFMPAARKKNINYYYLIADDVHRTLNGDPLRLRQVLINLAGNAVKFTEKGEIRIEVSKNSDSTSEKESLIFKVSDTGVGISAENQKKIFETFTQSDASISRKYGGSGLGLAICRSLAVMMEGDICLESSHNIGSTFIFTAKLKKIEASTIKPNYNAPMLDVGKNLISGKNDIKVLVVDDNEANQFLLMKILKKKVNTIKLASNGVEALKLLENEPFDIMFTDLQMPELDGYETTIRIRSGKVPEYNKNIIIVAMTGSVTMEERQKCRAAGMNVYITKPFNVLEIIEIVDKFLKNDINNLNRS